jgi:hypothetical protein
MRRRTRGSRLIWVRHGYWGAALLRYAPPHRPALRRWGPARRRPARPLARRGRRPGGTRTHRRLPHAHSRDCLPRACTEPPARSVGTRGGGLPTRPRTPRRATGPRSRVARGNPSGSQHQGRRSPGGHRLRAPVRQPRRSRGAMRAAPRDELQRGTGFEAGVAPRRRGRGSCLSRACPGIMVLISPATEGTSRSARGVERVFAE